MHRQNSENHSNHSATDRPLRRYSIAGAKAVGALLLLALAALVGWNMFAPDLLDLPRAQFRQAFGLVLFFGALMMLGHRGRAADRRGVARP